MAASRGVLQAGSLVVPCSLGRNGRKHLKREGDGATPVGRWRLVRLYLRADHGRRPVTRLPTRQIGRMLGWCDDPNDRSYNQPVRLPYAASHEEMWRSDELYDIVITLEHNTRPRVRYGGSAVFFHLASNDLGPTAGCVAVRREDMRRILAFCGPKTRMVVWPVRP
jgi:L,D-peptidoglycan transpeptidase YkuD (ErfK/YbiS/YcfS/YnhG family)